MSARAALIGVGASLMLGFAAHSYAASLADPQAPGLLSDLGADSFARAVLSQRSPHPYAGTALSPDGAWLAYTVEQPVGTVIADNDDGSYDSGVWKDSALYVMPLRGERAPKRIPSDTHAAWDPQWSADGRTLVFYTFVDGNIRLGVYDLAKADARILDSVNIAAGLNQTSSPAWLPDGSAVVLARLGAAVNARRPKPESDAIKDRLQSTVTTYVSGRGQSLSATRTQDASILASRPRVAIVRLDVHTGQTTPLLEAAGEDAPLSVRVSPSGRWLVFGYGVRSNSWQAAGGALPDDVPMLGENLRVIPVAGGAAVLSLPNVEMDGSAWAPRQDRLVYFRGYELWSADLRTAERRDSITTARLAQGISHLTSTGAGFTRDGSVIVVGGNASQVNSSTMPASLVWVPLDGSAARVLHWPENYRLRSVLRADSWTLWQPDAHAVTALLTDERADETVALRIPIEGAPQRAPTVIWKGLAEIRPLSASADHRTLVASYQTLWQAPELYAFDGKLARGRPFTTLGRELRLKAGSIRFLHTRVRRFDRSMITVRSALLLPPGASASTPVPLVVMQYPGRAMSDEAAHFGGADAEFPGLILLNHGYAVLLSDFPVRPPDGSAGNRIVEAADLLLPQVYRAGEEGSIDLDRVALYGQSQGGYMSTFIATHTGLFRAAINTSGMIFDYSSVYGLLRPGARGPYNGPPRQSNLGNNPWEDFIRYFTTSPFYQAQKIATPVLLAYGTRDIPELSAVEAGKMYNALLSLGKDGELLAYEGEGHVLWRGRENNALDLSARLLEFLDRHVRAGASPTMSSNLESGVGSLEPD